ncbi:MAG: metallophosphoesterase [Lachnospiraceae bacterium]|nr:metallophosphoesterase [Lachnospiraceae bacterium]
MKLIHCADLHLDSRMTSNLNKDKARERKAELLDTFTRMVDYAAENDVEAILIAGDLFDTRNISATARNVVRDAISGHEEILFFYLQGNHDTEHFFADWEDMPENVKLFGSSWRSYPLGSGSVVVSGLELSMENAAGAWHSLILDPTNFNIVMLHGQEAETGAKDQAEVIRLRDLKNKGIDHLALGHVHSFQHGKLDERGTWCYPGCLDGRGFDECGDHGFVLLDVDEETGACQRSFVPFASRRLHTISVDISGCEGPSEELERIQESLEKAEVSERDLLKIVLTGEMDVEDETYTEFLKKRLEPDFYFVKISDETTLRVDAERFYLDESLKGEFVRTVMAQEDLSDEDKAGAIRCGLRAIAGEEVLECD